MIDAERIFASRALRFARNDKTELQGFEENDYAPASEAARRSVLSLVREFLNMRASTADLYASFTEEMMGRTGKANGNEMSVRAIGYVICGHTLHHLAILQERYTG